MRIVGVDTGGTFTDCILLDGSRGVTFDKAPSTPRNYAEGVLASLEKAATGVRKSASDLLGDLTYFTHGTTVPLNCFYTRRGSRTVLLTTAGHEDAILIGRASQKVKGLSQEALTHVAWFDKPAPLVERRAIAGLQERVDWAGEVLVPLDEADVRQALRRFEACDPEAVAVSLLWSFVNPAHERQVRETIAASGRSLFVSLSSDISPLLGEYERTVSTVLNSYVGPPTARYLDSLGSELRRQGLLAPFLVMQSSGGVTDAAEAGRRAVYLMSSGPAGGIAASRFVGRMRGDANVITTDVGGTSFDVGLIVDGRPKVSSAAVYDRLEARIPTVDVTSIGAGGGSVARVDPLTRVLSVGPESAGADPGPACYGISGELATVTDADVVLGRLAPERFLGGRMSIRPELAARAIEQYVARPLGISVEAAALAIVTVIDAKMADLVRRVSIERGYDPRSFVIYAFGGGGPTHVGGYARDTGVRQAIVSPYAAVFSALGVAVSGFTHIYESSRPVPFPAGADYLAAAFREMETNVQRDVSTLAATGLSCTIERSVSLRLRYQVHEINVPLPPGTPVVDSLRGLERLFVAEYERLYGAGTAYTDAGMEAVTCRVTLGAHLPNLPFAPQSRGDGRPERAFVGRRSVCFDERVGRIKVPVYEGSRLMPGDAIEGPVVIENRGATLVVHPGQRVSVDDHLNAVVEL